MLRAHICVYVAVCAPAFQFIEEHMKPVWALLKKRDPTEKNIPKNVKGEKNASMANVSTIDAEVVFPKRPPINKFALKTPLSSTTFLLLR